MLDAQASEQRYPAATPFARCSSGTLACALPQARQFSSRVTLRVCNAPRGLPEYRHRCEQSIFEQPQVKLRSR